MHKFKTVIKKSKFLVLGGVFVFYLSLFAANVYAQDKIIAIVNSDVITQKDLDDFVSFMRLQLSRDLKGNTLEDRLRSLEKDLLNKLIEDRLILQEAKNSSVSVDENMVKARINEIKKNYPSENDFLNDLLIRGLTEFDIEKKIKEQLLMSKIIEQKVRQNIVITPKEVTNFYNQNIEKFKSEEIRKLEVVNFEEENQAQVFFSRIKTGVELQDLAKEFSLKIDNLEVVESELSEVAKNEVFSLNIGEVSKPVELNSRYYIFKIIEISPSKQFSLTEVQDSISMYLLEIKMQRQMEHWLNELKAKSYIKIL